MRNKCRVMDDEITVVICAIISNVICWTIFLALTSCATSSLSISNKVREYYNCLRNRSHRIIVNRCKVKSCFILIWALCWCTHTHTHTHTEVLSLFSLCLNNYTEKVLDSLCSVYWLIRRKCVYQIILKQRPIPYLRYQRQQCINDSRLVSSLGCCLFYSACRSAFVDELGNAFVIHSKWILNPQT